MDMQDSPISVNSLKITFDVNGKGGRKGVDLAREECMAYCTRYVRVIIQVVFKSRRRLNLNTSNQDYALYNRLDLQLSSVLSLGLGASGPST